MKLWLWPNSLFLTLGFDETREVHDVFHDDFSRKDFNPALVGKLFEHFAHLLDREPSPIGDVFHGVGESAGIVFGIDRTGLVFLKHTSATRA